MRILITFFLLCFNFSLFAANNVLNIYNWSGYISPEVLSKFTKETGIHVNYSTFDSNPQLYTKLKADPNINFDLIVPSSYMVQRMADENMLHPLNHAKLPNIKYLDPLLLNRSYDPGNRYTLPYLWGTTALLVNKQMYGDIPIDSWQSLWNPRFRDTIAMMDSARDCFAMAFLTLGYSVNDENPDHIREAYLRLRSLLPNVLSFTGDGSQQLFVNEDANVGMIESGDAMSVIKENPKFIYVYPKEGAIIWIDNMAIPKYAPHVANAYKFMNFVMRPEIAKMISESVGFSTPNLVAKKMLGAQIQNNPILYPPKSVVQHGHIESAISNKSNALYLKYFELLKLVG